MKMDMTEIKHHLTDALLMGYSAGSLPEAFNLVVATHISLCDECRARMHEFDAVGGEVMEMTSSDMGDDALAATLALIRRHRCARPRASRDRTHTGAARRVSR